MSVWPCQDHVKRENIRFFRWLKLLFCFSSERSLPIFLYKEPRCFVKLGSTLSSKNNDFRLVLFSWDIQLFVTGFNGHIFACHLYNNGTEFCVYLYILVAAYSVYTAQQGAKDGAWGNTTGQMGHGRRGITAFYRQHSVCLSQYLWDHCNMVSLILV